MGLWYVELCLLPYSKSFLETPIFYCPLSLIWEESEVVKGNQKTEKKAC